MPHSIRPMRIGRPPRKRALFLEPLERREVFAAGDLDTSFSSDGIVTSELFTASYETAYATAIQSDGKILAVGGNTSGIWGIVIARYTAAGALDTTFDGDGRLFTAIPNNNSLASAVAVQSDGKIVVAGQSANGTHDDFLLARYTAGGVLDTTFDGDGILTTDFNAGHDRVYGIVIQPDGKIVVAGSSASAGVDRFALARYNANGSLDTAFDTDGKVTTALGAEGAAVRGLVLQADGKLVAGGSTTAAGNTDFALARYNGDGALDTTFDTDGFVTTELGGQDLLRGVALQTDNKIVVAGSSTAGGAADFALARFETSGALDATFDTDGKVITDYWTGANGANAVAVQSNGKIVAAGYQFNGSTDDVAIARFNANGSADTSFGTNGRSSADINGANNAFNALAIQSNGQAIAVGGTQRGTGYDVLVRRYLADGSNTDISVLTSDFRTSFQSANTVLEQPDGKILVGGRTAGNDGVPVFTVARYFPSGTLDTFGFGQGGVVSSTLTVESQVWDLALQPDGKILALGSGLGQPALVRYLPNGALDTTFDGDGMATVTYPGRTSSGFSVALQPDGKIVIVGGVSAGGTEGNFSIARFLPNGALDAAFSGDGLVEVDMGTGFEGASSVALQSDGKIVVAGKSNGQVAVLRLTADGTEDSTFDGDGRKTISVLNMFSVESVGLQSDGKIVVAGYWNFDFGALRLTTGGALDTSFQGGIVYTDFNSGSTELMWDALVDRQDRIVMAGTTVVTGGQNHFAVARLAPDGLRDFTFSGDGLVTTQVYGADQVLGVALQQDGKILAAGQAGANGNTDIALVRYLGHEGTLGGTFDAGGNLFVLDGGVKNNNLVVDQNGALLTITENNDRFQQASGGTLSSDYRTFSVNTAVTPLASVLISGNSGIDSLTINADLVPTSGGGILLSAETLSFGPGVDVTADGIFTEFSLGADTMEVDPTATVSTTGFMQINAGTTGRNFTFGAEAANSLSLTDAELDRMTAVTIAFNTHGVVTVAGDVTHAGPTNFQITAGGGIVISGGVLDVGAGFASLQASSPNAVRPIKAGLDVRASAVRPSGRLGIAIDGTAVDTGFTQLKLEGLFQIGACALELSGSYVPQPGDRFVIVDNDGTDVIGTRFTDLAEGATITFNGVPLTITYSGGTGNDVELVAPVPDTPQVDEVTTTTAGVQITLTDPIDLATLNLYDYRDASGQLVLGPADMTLVGANVGPIIGSLIVAPGNMSLTFFATNGLLPPDTYTLTLRSAANGFRTAAGDLLDGNGDGTTGDSYVTSFTVAAPALNAIVVGVPNFARGPEQTVNVPATSPGLPIQVSDGGGLTALSFDLAFNPGLLAVTNVILVGGGTATLTPGPAGQVHVALTFSTPLASGPQSVAYLIANVPSSAASRYGERGVLDLSALSLTAGGSVSGIDRDAVQVNAYVGDAGRNGRYDSFDVQQASRMALRLDTGFQQHPLLDATILADFNGNSRVDSFDVQQLSRLALRLPVSATPALPNPAPTTIDTDRLLEEPPTKNAPPRSDVDGSGAVDAQDVAFAVYYFKRSANGVAPAEAAGKKLDLNDDQSFDAADILLAITDLNPRSPPTYGEDLDALAYLLAEDRVASRKKK